MKKLIYLASPYSHDFADVKARRVRQVTDAAARLTEKGFVIFSPIVHSHQLAEQGLEGGWDFWKEIDLTIISKSDEVWVLCIQDWEKSVGVKEEIEFAKAQGKRVVYLKYPQLTFEFSEQPDPSNDNVLHFEPKAQGVEAVAGRGKMVIGLCGYAQSGKDTLGQYLVEHEGFQRVSFADGVREALLELNPFIPNIDKRLNFLVENYTWEGSKASSEVRELLQRMGTEVGRNMFGENCWVEIARRKAEQFDKVVFTDVRFPNEARFVRELGGTLIRIKREGIGAVNSHSSETALDGFSADLELHNNGTIDDLIRNYEAGGFYNDEKRAA